LPKFVYGQTDKRSIPEASPQLLPVAAPVIYFHAPQPQAVNVRVDFPKGKPAVWWPANTNIARKPDQSLRDNYLEWQLQVKSPAAGPLSEKPLPKGHWMEALRAVKADHVLARDVSQSDLTPAKEKFVYYDGLIPAPVGLTISVAGDKVTLRNQAKYAVFDVTVVDRRTPGKVRVARLAQLDAGAEKQGLDFRAADPTRWPAAGLEELVGQLKAAGLHDDEARALANVWKKEFFETEGLGLFYRLPQSEYDRMLPLTVTPKPEKVTRVLLVHHPHCEPDLAERVLGLVKQLGADDFNGRVEAHKRLQGLGRAGFVHMVRARKTTSDPEIRARLKKLLEEFEAEQALQR
jgi:hypothetical protein